MSLKKITFIISIAVVIYFTAFSSLHRFYHDEAPPAFIGAIIELLTIPMLVLAPVFLVISFTQLIKEKFNYRSTYLYSFLLLFIVTICLVAVTMIGMQGETIESIQGEDTIIAK